MTDQARKRKESVDLLEELRVAGLLTYQVEHRNWEGPEPRVEIFTERDALRHDAPLWVSEAARTMWDLLRAGKLARKGR